MIGNDRLWVGSGRTVLAGGAETAFRFSVMRRNVRHCVAVVSSAKRHFSVLILKPDFYRTATSQD
jgi:hypothetical protein